MGRPPRSVDELLKYSLVLLEKAEVPVSDRAALLGVSPSTLRRYQRGLAVPRSPKTIGRMTELLRCYVALKTILPYESELVFRWFCSPNTTLSTTPVAYAKRHGIDKVRRYLEVQVNN